MKKLSIILFLLAITIMSYGQNTKKWLRYPSLSPDGKQVVFSYNGDIFRVSTSGGRALQLTTNRAYDTRPIWSPDGSKIVFASNREGNFDLYVIDANGGMPKRITTNTANEYPMSFLGNDKILFRASIMQDAKDGQFASSIFSQVYEVGIEGGRPKMFSSLAMDNVQPDKQGNRILYTDIKGYENEYRKHQTSSIARDIWLLDKSSSPLYKKITNYKGEDRNAVWGSGDNYYYLSEQKGSFNVFKSSIKGGTPKQISFHDKTPVRDLSISNNQTLCYSYGGDIYTLIDGEKPQKINVSIYTDRLEPKLSIRNMYGGASDIAISPNGKEIAFVLRGDVFVTSTDYKTTNRITNTAEQERDVDFSPDGRSIIYSSERDGVWSVYMSSLVDSHDKSFVYAKKIKEERITTSDIASFQPKFSPDGKEIAFLEDRTTRRIINLKTRKIRTILDGKYNYSYSDGDQWYQWSPDGEWMLTGYIGIGGWNNIDVAVVKTDGSGKVINLTESGYSDGNAKWVLGGKAMIWGSDRSGYRSHGSWGAESDIYIMFFDNAEYEKFLMSKEEKALLAEKEKAYKPETPKTENSKKKIKPKKKPKKETKKKEKLKLDFENAADRVLRLTMNSSFLADGILSKNGDKLYYLARFEAGYDLWVRDIQENSTKILVKGAGGYNMVMDSKGDSFYMIAGGGRISKVELSSGRVKGISFEAEFQHKPYEEREYIFEHVWRQVKDKLYAPDYNGVNWDEYKNIYKEYLSSIENNFDFADLLSEMLGELNVSHTGARYRTGGGGSTAYLGAFFDNNYDGDGLRIEEIIPMGPLDNNNSPINKLTNNKNTISKGDIIKSIDGIKIMSDTDYYPLLLNKSGKEVSLTIRDISEKKDFTIMVKPISYGRQSAMLYNRWVKQREAIVDSISGGKIAYVHIQGMNSRSFRSVYSKLLGKYRNRKAVIVDTRHNGGGWLHDDLVTLLTGKEYCKYTPRGKYIGSDPFAKWTKPSCVLVCEDNYSNAHGFPFIYQYLGIGKLIGAPVPGTMTAVWWELQIDNSLVFGIPQVGVKDMNGNYMENRDLHPDILVYNSPNEQLQGIDKQLEKAVYEMINETKK